MKYEPERYEFYKDNTLTASFTEQDPIISEKLDRKDIESEFEAYVSFWRSKGSKATFELRTILTAKFKREGLK